MNLLCVRTVNIVIRKITSVTTIGTHIGMVTEVHEDNEGAYFTAILFPTDEAQKVRHIARAGLLWQASFEFSVIDYGRIRAKDGNKVTELRELELYEISLVLHPANRHTAVTCT